MLSYIWLGIAALLVAVDQLVKFWAEHSLSQVDTIPLISGVFHLTYVQNFGAAFNTMNNQRFLLVGVTSAVLLLILVLLLTQKLDDLQLESDSVGRCGQSGGQTVSSGRLCGGPV